MKPIAIRQNEFEQEVLKTDGLVIVNFWAPWSRPCRIVFTVLEVLGERLKGQVKIVTVNADKYPDLAKEFGVVRIPTLLFFSFGKIVDREEGLSSVKFLEDRIQRLTPVAPESCTYQC